MQQIANGWPRAVVNLRLQMLLREILLFEREICKEMNQLHCKANK